MGMNAIYDRRYETLSAAEREQFQWERLQALLNRLQRNVRRYREKLEGSKIESLADLSSLPFTTAEELADAFPYGLFSFPLREIIRIHSTVGPEGKPLVIGHTRNDLIHWGRLVARQLVAAGVTANDVIQISLGGNATAGSSGFALGGEQVEASLIAEDPYHLDYQLAMLQNYRPTILITTPSNASDLMRLIDQKKIDPQSLHLRTVLLSRPVSVADRDLIKASLFAAVRCNFGIGEMLDPGFCTECEHGCFHANEDQFLVESVDNELVVTSLTREAMPLLRYRTRIAGVLSRDKCPCGRTGAIIQPGQRLDQRLLINETPLYPSQIAEVLSQSLVAGRPFQTEVLERHLVVRILMTPEFFSDTIWVLEKTQRQIQSDFLSRLGIEAVVRFVEPRSWTGK